ncbi:MAG TPA: hypothetical protein PKD85_21100, partial [Saprospiraceae bacterium]|nr:hypothetical protein [Saprospiraceae bacterium]
DSKLLGFVLGAILPLLGFILVDTLFEFLSQQGLMAQTSGAGVSRRMRTVALLAICSNLIPFQWAKRNRYDDTMRGIIFPTLIYVGYWVYFFYDHLF